MSRRPRERVRLETRRHGVVLVWPLARSLALGAVGVVLTVLGWPASLAGAAVLALAAALAVRSVWRWERTRVVVTTERLLVVDGTLRRRSAAVPLSRVAVEVEQDVLGRLFGYGTIVAGELEVDHVPAPSRVSRLAA